MSYLSSHSKKNPASGFGLIELMVSISIMALVSAVVLTRHSAFNGAVLLRSQTYEVALQLRDVQLTAVSAAFVEGGFTESVGAIFTSRNGENGLFLIFRDLNDDGILDNGEEFGQRGLLDPRFEIRDVRAYDASGSTIDLEDDQLSVMFQRPNFDARFFDSDGPVTGALTVEIDIARVGESGTGPEVVRTVEVTSAGQIAVKGQ